MERVIQPLTLHLIKRDPEIFEAVVKCFATLFQYVEQLDLMEFLDENIEIIDPVLAILSDAHQPATIHTYLLYILEKIINMGFEDAAMGENDYLDHILKNQNIGCLEN